MEQDRIFARAFTDAELSEHRKAFGKELDGSTHSQSNAPPPPPRAPDDEDTEQEEKQQQG